MLCRATERGHTKCIHVTSPHIHLAGVGRTCFRPIYHVPADNSKGYVGDANGLMFRRSPWNSTSDVGGFFHQFWQCVPEHNAGQSVYRLCALPGISCTHNWRSGLQALIWVVPTRVRTYSVARVPLTWHRSLLVSRCKPRLCSMAAASHRVWARRRVGRCCAARQRRCSDHLQQDRRRY